MNEKYSWNDQKNSSDPVYNMKEQRKYQVFAITTEDLQERRRDFTNIADQQPYQRTEQTRTQSWDVLRLYNDSDPNGSPISMFTFVWIRYQFSDFTKNILLSIAHYNYGGLGRVSKEKQVKEWNNMHTNMYNINIST